MRHKCTAHLFYSYEPPHFIPVQPESKEWHFSTQTPYQMPEIDTTGCLATKHHA